MAVLAGAGGPDLGLFETPGAAQVRRQTMRVYDVTLTITPNLPTWPGDQPVVLERVEKIEDGGAANITRVTMSAHTGTHIDAPYHFLSDGETVDHISLKTLIAPLMRSEKRLRKQLASISVC